jgi:hypothetical protein
VVTTPARTLVEIAEGLASIASGKEEAEMAGPVAIARAAGASARRGAGDLLLMTAAMLTYVWPLVALLAVVFVPRRARKKG